MKTAALLGMAAVALLSAGCARQIVYPWNSAYEKRVATFAIKPEAAFALVARSAHSSSPSAVIDREYLFSKPYKYARIDLTGIYVNGDNGRVEKRTSPYSLRAGLLTGWPRRLPPAWSAQPIHGP